MDNRFVHSDGSRDSDNFTSERIRDQVQVNINLFIRLSSRMKLALAHVKYADTSLGP